ncbi:uncharacterized protein GIQ15_03628 [Arthroderma uncinatum]|uniref:uncharacterized protein n=1 Tax=Arthroderma uncinatum TaxID=74035 RepID=UPI00144AB4AE|nr:uncharacterized protein GIQ15_03628 [Arthroderma uncinatum]KAF3484304.1 hypothetical protein GIQ15_03628 [Arthroderma uncinatum]
MANDKPLTQAIVRSLLRSPFQAEDSAHPWALEISADPSQPLLRTWDSRSGSQPDAMGRMFSRSPRERLDTATTREKFLAIHADHKRWDPTPFISFTQSPDELQENAKRRAQKRGSQTITALNPNVRAKNGLPILNMDKEMRFYGVPDPYGKSNEYYKNHYVCLWEVAKEEIVGHWEWADLLETDHWYEDIILPTFKTHNRNYFGGGAFDMSALLDLLPEPQVSATEARPFHRGFGFSDFDTSSEGEEVRFVEDCFEEEYDSYDEVEEDNAADDSLNGI